MVYQFRDTFSYCLVVKVVVTFSRGPLGYIVYPVLVSRPSGVLYMGEEGFYIS